MLRLVRKIKGDNRIILVSDANAETGKNSARYDGSDDINFDSTGEIAGTKLTLDKACRNMMFHTGSSVCQLFKYASENPAKLLSLQNRGSIGKGKLANLVVVDSVFNVKHVFFKGKQIN
jgi:N-acetylglucosamine-6-phosphate deacetylase